jgi:hypothetical protein
MSIRFPKSCKTAAQRSEHARRVVGVRWQRRRQAASHTRTDIGYIEIGGALAAGVPMRLNLVAVDGRPKWEGWSEGKLLDTGISERTLIQMIRTILRTPRQNPLQSPSDSGRSVVRLSALSDFASVCDPLTGKILTNGGD